MGEMLRSASYQPHVLLAESDESALRVEEHLLQSCGYRVTVARDGQEALNIFKSHHRSPIDLLLTDDLMASPVNGIDLVREVTSNKNGADVPAIVMSAQANQELICTAHEAGAVDLLMKPIRHNEVVTMWQHVWKSSCMPQEYEGAERHAGGQKKFSGPRRAFTPDTSAVDTRALSGGMTQEDGSGCEGQSSCTLLAPSAKRIRRDYRASLTSPILESACSFESTAPHAYKSPLDVVGDNGGHLTLSAGDAEMSDGEDEGGKPQVPAVRPHEAPIYSSTHPAMRASLPRNVSAPSMLASEAMRRAGMNPAAQPHSCDRLPCTYGSSSMEAARERPAATEDDSDNSTATAQDTVGDDAETSPFAAFSKFSGCEAMAVSSHVDLKITPLDLAPWPSSASSLGRQLSMLPSLPALRTESREQQAEAAAASLCVLTKAFAAAAAGPVPRSAPPLLQPLKVTASAELSLYKARTPTSEPSHSPSACAAMGPQQTAFGKALRGAADLHSGVTQGDPAVWAANRKAALEKLREKKKLRSFRKKVRYESRRRLAESRPRVRGQFVKAGVSVEACA